MLPALVQRVLGAARGRIGPALKQLHKVEGLAPAERDALEGATIKAAAQGLSAAKGIPLEAATGRVVFEALESLGAATKPGAAWAVAKPLAGGAEFAKRVVEPGRHLKVGETGRKLVSIPHWHGAANPAYVDEYMLGAGSNMAPYLAEMTSYTHGNTAGFTRALQPHLFGLDDPRKLKGFTESMAKGFAAFHPYQQQIMTLEQQISPLAKQLGFVPGQLTPRNLAKRARALGTPEAEQLAALVEKQQLLRQEALRQQEPLFRYWAERSSGFRAFLGAAEQDYPWAQSMLNNTERRASKAIRESLDQIMKAADAEGIPVITSRQYVPHYMGSLLGYMEKHQPQVYKDIAPFYNLPQMRAWAHRSPGSLLWWPVPQHLPEYYYDAFRNIHGTRFLKEWGPVVKRLEELGHTKEATFYKNWLKDVIVGDEYRTWGQRMLQKAVGLEYFDKVGFSFGTGFKHLLKSMKTFAQHPLYFSKGVAMGLKEAGRKMYRGLGGKGLELAEPGWERLGAWQLQSRALLRGFTGVDPNLGQGKYLFNLAASSPTAMVEALERYAILTGMMMKSASKGVGLHRMIQQSWHQYIDLAFAGQIDRYPWLKGPLRQLFMLFYYTPARVTENTLKTIGFGIFKEPLVQKVRQTVGGRMSTGLIDAGKRWRGDPLGDRYINKALRTAAVIGMAEGLARAYDTSIYEMAAFHLPFLRRGRTGKSELVMPPPADVILRINREGLVSGMLGHIQLASTQKIMRTLFGSTETIPEMYRPPYSSPAGQKVRYLLSLPSMQALGTMNERELLKERKRQEGLQRRRLGKGEWRATAIDTIDAFKNWLGHTSSDILAPRYDPDQREEGED